MHPRPELGSQTEVGKLERAPGNPQAGDADREGIVHRRALVPGFRLRRYGSYDAFCARLLSGAWRRLAILGFLQHVGQIHRLVLGDDQTPCRRQDLQFTDVQAVRLDSQQQIVRGQRLPGDERPLRLDLVDLQLIDREAALVRQLRTSRCRVAVAQAPGGRQRTGGQMQLGDSGEEGLHRRQSDGRQLELQVGCTVVSANAAPGLDLTTAHDLGLELDLHRGGDSGFKASDSRTNRLQPDGQRRPTASVLESEGESVDLGRLHGHAPDAVHRYGITRGRGSGLRRHVRGGASHDHAIEPALGIEPGLRLSVDQSDLVNGEHPVLQAQHAA